MSSSHALVSAIVQLLKSTTDIQFYLGSDPCVFDAPDKNASLPYIVVSDVRETIESSSTECISIHDIKIIIISHANSLASIRGIADATVAAISLQNLNPAGHKVANIAVAEIAYARDDKNRTQTSTILYRIVTEPAQ